MENNQSSKMAGLLVLVVCAVMLLVGKRFFPGLGTRLLVILGILGLLLVLFLAFILFLAFHQEKDSKKEETTSDATEILHKSRSELLELRRVAMQVRDSKIRLLSGEVCRTMEKILKELQEKPEEIPDARQFLRYYLPTCRSILSRYVHMESSGVLEPEFGDHVAECMEDIKSAMAKQYDNLFEDEKLDLTVEMETLTVVCKKDGLLDEEM